MKNLADEILADFGVDIKKTEEKPKYYKFTSNKTSVSQDILVFTDDIIKDGELRRIIRDTTGEIPEWATPRNNKQDYIRITPDGKVYGKTGKLIKARQSSGRYIVQGLNSQNVACSISLVICMHTSFNFEQFRKTGSAYTLFQIEDGIDITTLRNEYSTKYYGKTDSKKSDQKDEYDMINTYRHKLNGIKYRCRHTKAYENITINNNMVDIQTGAKWYKEGCGYRLKSGSQLDIEKDIAGNNEYSLETCLITPYYINSYFVGMHNHNVGVHEGNSGWQARVKEFGTNRNIHLGTFKSFKEAHKNWADFKNKQLQEVVIPYFIEDVFEEDREHPMVLKVIEALRNFKFN